MNNLTILNNNFDEWMIDCDNVGTLYDSCGYNLDKLYEIWSNYESETIHDRVLKTLNIDHCDEEVILMLDKYFRNYKSIVGNKVVHSNAVQTIILSPNTSNHFLVGLNEYCECIFMMNVPYDTNKDILSVFESMNYNTELDICGVKKAAHILSENLINDIIEKSGINKSNIERFSVDISKTPKQAILHINNLIDMRLATIYLNPFFVDSIIGFAKTNAVTPILEVLKAISSSLDYHEKITDSVDIFNYNKVKTDIRHYVRGVLGYVAKKHWIDLKLYSNEIQSFIETENIDDVQCFITDEQEDEIDIVLAAVIAIWYRLRNGNKIIITPENPEKRRRTSKLCNLIWSKLPKSIRTPHGTHKTYVTFDSKFIPELQKGDILFASAPYESIRADLNKLNTRIIEDDVFGIRTALEDLDI